MTIYIHRNLLHIEQSHPGVREILLSRALSVRLTNKSFTRTPVNLTLEQSVDADAASRMTGISSFTKNINARQRWMITNSARSAILGCLFELAGLKKYEDATQEFKHHCIPRDNSDTKKTCQLYRKHSQSI